MGISMAVSFIPIVGPIISCIIDGTFVDMFNALMKGDWATVGMCAMGFVPGMKALKGLKAVGGFGKVDKLVGKGFREVTIKKGTSLYRVGGISKETGKSFRHGGSYTSEKLSMYGKREIKAGTGPMSPGNPADTVYKFKAKQDIVAYVGTSRGGYFSEVYIPGHGNDDILQEVMQIPVYDL